jgi:hypothetical protein
MQLDTAIRTRLADRIVERLAAAAPGSEAVLRGSLAEQRADQYSDIDVLWDVPDTLFGTCVATVRGILSTLHPVESFRSDPEWQNSDKRRLFFVRFAAIPLFWRLDLDVDARSIHSDHTYDAGNPRAQGYEWSWTESALANGMAAVKAYLRHNEGEARVLLERAYQRVGLAMPECEVRDLILVLATEVEHMDVQTRGFAQRLKQLVADAF